MSSDYDMGDHHTKGNTTSTSHHDWYTDDKGLISWIGEMWQNVAKCGKMWQNVAKCSSTFYMYKFALVVLCMKPR